MKIGQEKANVIVENLIDLGIQVIDTDWTLTKKAASYKLLGGISYADCFAAALASLKNAKLLTCDLEFERVNHEVEIIWLER